MDLLADDASDAAVRDVHRRRGVARRGDGDGFGDLHIGAMLRLHGRAVGGGSPLGVRGARDGGEQCGGVGKSLDHGRGHGAQVGEGSMRAGWGEIANASVERSANQTFLVGVRGRQLRAPTEWARGRATYLSGCSGGLERRGRRPRRMRVNMAPRAVSAEMPTHARYTAATALPVTELFGIGDGEGTSHGVARETIEKAG